MINCGKSAGKALFIAVGSRGIRSEISFPAIKDGLQIVSSAEKTANPKASFQSGRCAKKQGPLLNAGTTRKAPSHDSLVNNSSTQRSSYCLPEQLQRVDVKPVSEALEDNMAVNALLPAPGVMNFASHLFSDKKSEVIKSKQHMMFQQVRDLSSAVPSIGGIDGIITTLNQKLNADIVNETQAIYQFNIMSGDRREIYYIDLRNGSGSAGKGKSEENPDTIFCIDAENFNKLVSGTLKGPTAFMKGKMKISGSMQKAVKLEKLFTSLLDY